MLELDKFEFVEGNEEEQKKTVEEKLYEGDVISYFKGESFSPRRLRLKFLLSKTAILKLTLRINELKVKHAHPDEASVKIEDARTIKIARGINNTDVQEATVRGNNKSDHLLLKKEIEIK